MIVINPYKSTKYVIYKCWQQPLPILKYPYNKNILEYYITFNSNCMHPIMENDDCNGDWNKLIFFGDLNPHHTGINFVWRIIGDNTNRKMELGWYMWYNGVSPQQSPYRKGTIMTIFPNVPYLLKIDLSTTNEVKWFVNNSLVNRLTDIQVCGKWLSSSWFGGGDMGDCIAPQKMSYEIKMIKH